jgi:hypothetical protein
MKAVALSQYVTAREVSGPYILIFKPSDQMEGNYIPASEIYLKREQIALLAAQFPVEEKK